MIDLQQCQKFLPKDLALSEEEVRSVRSSLYGLASVVLEGLGSYDERTQNPSPAPEKDKYDIEERAAMLEHDAGIPKRLAEIIALDDYSHGKSLQEEPDPEE